MHNILGAAFLWIKFYGNGTRVTASLVYSLYPQVSYRKEVEERLGELKAEHTQQVSKLATELQRLKGDQTKQVRQVCELREGFARKAEEQVKSLRSKHEKELNELMTSARIEQQKLEEELKSLRADHNKELEHLRQTHKLELEGEKERLGQAQSELISAEAERRRKMEQSLDQKLAEREEDLKQQVSKLSSELRASKDKLALAEQRVHEIEVHCQDSKEDSSSLKDKLQAALGEAEELRTSVGALENELEIAREQYMLQSVEMQGLSGE